MKRFFIFLISLVLANSLTGQEHIRLLMRADDMGNTHDINLAIIKAHKEGIITSASIMPTAVFFEEAAKLCKANPSLIIGVHVTLAASKLPTVLPPDEVPQLVNEAGYLYETAEDLMKENPSEEEMEKEIRAQIEKVKSRGVKITYIDYHRNIPEAAKKIIIKICDEQKMIYGQERKGELYGYTRVELMPETWPFQFMPDGQRIYYAGPAFGASEHEIFYNKLSELTPGNWIAAVHPGLNDPQRRSVTELLCSPKTAEIIKSKRIKVISYHDIWLEKYSTNKK